MYEWSRIETIVKAEERSQYIRIIWDQISRDVGDMSQEDFIRFVEEKKSESDQNNSGNLRWDEFQQFMQSSASRNQRDSEFLVKKEDLSESLSSLSHLLRVESLKEIRALRSFTRIEPPPGNPPVKSQYLSVSRKDWLPAIEVRGEGIFLALDKTKLHQWENLASVQERAQLLRNYNESRVLNPDQDKDFESSPQLGARFLLLHALAHAVMKQLALQCGYSSASLRERLYVGTGEKEMAGVMIYTATSDSDGTLGGLQRQGQTSRFEGTFVEAIRANEWCSSDPLCIKGLVAATESSSLATCHSCLLAPETSCEEFNRFLDRAMLVGTPEQRELGFFHHLLGR